MTRLTVAQLQALVVELQAEVAELRTQLEQRTERWQPMPAQPPISTPIDFAQLMSDLVTAHAAYDESTGWGANTYL